MLPRTVKPQLSGFASLVPIFHKYFYDLQQNLFPLNYVMKLRFEVNLLCSKAQICTCFILTHAIIITIVDFIEH